MMNCGRGVFRLVARYMDLDALKLNHVTGT